MIQCLTQPQWAAPPRQHQLTPPGTTEFVICDHTIEVTIKELKSGLHLGQMQVTKDKERVMRSVALSVLAYLLLVQLYGSEEAVVKDGSLFKLKERFIGEVAQDAIAAY